MKPIAPRGRKAGNWQKVIQNVHLYQFLLKSRKNFLMKQYDASWSSILESMTFSNIETNWNWSQNQFNKIKFARKECKFVQWKIYFKGWLPTDFARSWFFLTLQCTKKTLTTKTIQTETVCNTKFQFIFQQLWGSLQHILNLFRNLWNLGSEKSEF